jgi:hypothetical protein
MVDIDPNLFSKASVQYSSDGDNEKNTLRISGNHYRKNKKASIRINEDSKKEEPDGLLRKSTCTTISVEKGFKQTGKKHR